MMDIEKSTEVLYCNNHMRNNYFSLTGFFSKNRQSILSLLMLFAFLCATISHSSHAELIQDNVELQQCKLCQHNIDTPQNSLTVRLVTTDSYCVPAQTLTVRYNEISFYLIPQLRAPPIQ